MTIREAAPECTRTPMPLRQAVRDAERMECAVNGCLFENDTLKDHVSDELEASNCIFHRVSFTNIQVRHTHFMNCVFDHCEFISFPMNEGSIRQTLFRDCRMSGHSFEASRLTDVILLDTRYQYGVFSNYKAERVRFENCDLKGSSFIAVRQKDLVFQKCVLTETEFSGSPLKGVDLSDSILSGWRTDPALLRGAALSQEQAADIMALLGIIVK